MNRVLLSLLAALTLGSGPLGVASAVTFGGLNVAPRGPQNLNLQTGATEFPQGGVVTDARSGLRLNAAQLNLTSGERLDARNATLTLRQGGSLSAQTVRYDLSQGTVTASGHVAYNDARFKQLSADRLVLHVKTGFVVAEGDVRASTPALRAETLAFDTRTAQALLSGEVQLSQAAALPPGQPLLLTFSGPRLLRVTRPDAAALSRFAPYLK